ncbi:MULTISPECIES: CAP domain-containing protein [Actinomadura]|uniref:CAP domain-containing protein n=1 Tax=Actinomadura TaxID=1988 RepID=UPI00260CBDB0|nr:CAP domain-containing protein [Actinomadura geliboluensis]
MSNPLPPRAGGPGPRRRQQRTVSGRAAAWTAAGAAGVLVIGGIAGMASGAFDGGPGAAPAASDTSVSPSSSPVAPLDTAKPSPSETASPKQTRKEPRKTSKPRTPTPRATRSRPAAPPPARPKTPSAPVAGGAAAQVISLVNKERAKNGCRALTSNGKLAVAAQGHSADMARRGFFDHTNPDGKSPGDRITAAGYRWSTYGENIAKGQPTPASVMTSWMNSPGHRANILNCSFREIGVGVVKSGGPYWTQVFGAAR